MNTKSASMHSSHPGRAGIRPRAHVTAAPTAFSPKSMLHERRRAILKSAAASFNQKGFANTSMDDVAKALGITKPTLYKYYPSKHEILVECHLLALTYAENALTKAEAGRTGLEKAMIFAHENMRGLLGELGTFPVISDVDALLPPHRKRVVRKRKAVSTALRAIISEGMTDGSIRVSSSNLATMFVFGVFNWIPIWYRTNGENTPDQIRECFEAMLLSTLKGGT
jgi:TetR/AcrR family transcriptional regulator